MSFPIAVVTSQEYPQRVAFRLLTEARAEFDQQFSEEISHAKHLGLSKTAKPLLKKLAGTYEDLKTVDKITNVALQVEQVKGMMQNNIEAALKVSKATFLYLIDAASMLGNGTNLLFVGVLQNQDNLETLLDTSDTMRNEASSFNKSTTGVKDRMRWKNTKYMLLIAFFLIVLVAVIVVPIVLKNRGTPAAAKT